MIDVVADWSSMPEPGVHMSEVPEAWQRIVIASDQIETIAVLYVEPEDDDSASAS